METLVDVVYEDAELAVFRKPAGLVCHPTKGDVYSSLISRIRLYLGEGARPHLIHRLDRETSGLVLVAKTDEAAAELRRIWENRQVRKEYLAIAHGFIGDDEGVIDAPLGKDRESRVAIKDCVTAAGAASQTEFSVLRRFWKDGNKFSLVRLYPRTGRKHQIRIHLAHIGHAVVGDKLYGGDENIYLSLVEGNMTEDQKNRLILPYHALHARSLEFEWRGVRRQWETRPEIWFEEFVGGEMGGQ